MLDRIRAEGIPYELDTDELDRIDAMIGSRRTAAVAEQPARYATQQADELSGIDDLRMQFRPDAVRLLFVGESSPAGGTHFYRAYSNLFRAVHEAFARVFGEEVPAGPAFLHYFRAHGAWLVDLADRPVNRMEDRARTSTAAAGIERLASSISETRPAHILAVKASIETAVRQAAQMANVDVDIVVLPFPVRQWRAVFVRKLAAELRAWSLSGDTDR
jgi:hypothetical protein